MVTVKQLKTQNPEYDPDCIIKTDLLYEGGTTLSKHANIFLDRGEDEGDQFYKERLMTAYDPIFANTLDRFKSLLFSVPLTILPSADTNNAATPSKPLDSKLKEFLHQFEKDCDGKGTSFHNFCKESFLTALKHTHSLTMVDMPAVEKVKDNLADQLAAGDLNGYLIDIPLASMIDWQRDEMGDLVWIKLFCESKHRDHALAPLMCLYRWTLIQMEDGVVTFRIFEKDINLDTGEKLDDEMTVPEVKKIITSFKELNVVEMCMSPGLALGNVIGPACEQLFRTDALINAAAQRNTISLAIWKAGDNVPRPGSDGRRAINTVQMNPSRFGSPAGMQKTSGWHTIGKDDDAMILETEGKAITILQEQKKIIIERINAAVHQVAQNIQSRGTAVAQSAAAKQEDRRDTEIVLSEFKLIVETFALKIIKLLLQLRQQEMVELHMEGLNVEDDIDRAQLLQEIIAYGHFPEAPIFRVNYEYNNALGLLTDDLSDDDKQELRAQIEDAVKKRAAIEDMQAQQGIIPGQSSKTAPGKPGQPKTNETEDDASMALGPAGQPLMPEGAHLQTGEHIDSKVVHDQLSKDYKKKDIEFVKQIPWIGPTEVPLSSIDFSNKDNWQATQEPDKVDEFADKMANEGFSKPIILVNNPSNDNKMMVVDGHHRALAAMKNGTPVNAFIGQIGSDEGPWQKLHAKQVGSQTEKSIQKEVSNQIEKSEEDAE